MLLYGTQFRETNKIGKDAEQVFVKEEIETDPIVKRVPEDEIIIKKEQDEELQKLTKNLSNLINLTPSVYTN